MDNIKKSKIMITGHRGAAGLAPENTISAIKLGMKYADRIEIDVHQSKDKKIIVMHDKTVNRTTDGKGHIKNMTLGDIKSLDAGLWFSSKYIGEKVPTLEEVIDIVCPTKTLVIEIKDHDYKDIESNIVDIILKKNVVDNVIIQSFSISVLDLVHNINPNIKLHKLFIKSFYILGIKLMVGTSVNLFDFKKYSYIEEYSLYHRFIFYFSVKQLDRKTRGKKINVWVENDIFRAKKFIDYGVDGFITDFPDRYSFLGK
jgi:glycerophosphoryl diester phosphodiesterase